MRAQVPTLRTAIARTAAQLDPKTPLGADYMFEKVFSDADYFAGGIIQIPVKCKKPSKPSNDNTYVCIIRRSMYLLLMSQRVAFLLHRRCGTGEDPP